MFAPQWAHECRRHPNCPSAATAVGLRASRRLRAERVCIHLSTEQALVCAASLGLPPALLTEWARLPYGPAGGPVGLAAAAEKPFVEENVRTGYAWAPFSALAAAADVASSWSVPVMGPGGHLGVITVFRHATGGPQRDQLDLVNLYAGYAASAIERDRLLDQATARNRVLETIREMQETLAGPIPSAEGLGLALQSLRQGLQADEVALLTQPPGQPPLCRALASAPMPNRRRGAGAVSTALLERAEQVLTAGRRDGVARHLDATGGQRFLAVTFGAPGGPTALLAGWNGGGSWRDREDWPGGLSGRAGIGGQAADATALLEDAAHSLRLALEREEAVLAHQEAAALRRSQELQRGFLSRLSHEHTLARRNNPTAR